ncbi:MAG: TonB-dependent receptor [Candidatus Eremiobacteraeota bacterium]|nr:TonB-dependent receptor [Candidatus Eremiobacteraeota bacterium]
MTLGTLLGASICFQPAQAGTTGGLTGRVVDSQTQAPLADVSITVTAATQSAASTTDASGSFRFLSLNPDTFTIQLRKNGYDDVSYPGVTIFADQVQNLRFAMVKSLKTIARVASTAAGNLVKAGSGSDVYSVNSTVANAASGLTGSGSLSNAYGAIASVPGVAIDPGESGWFQTVHIRGGDIDQVGYELDGIPVNRVYDNAPMTMLSSLGQQELQVYTGGTPAGADAQGISGYINQVVKTGTYPGYGSGSVAVGSPTFYHNASVEAGGSTPDRRFSYYIGIGGSNQDYRYMDNYNGASQFNSFFYPVNLVDPNAYFATGAISNNGYVYTGGNGTNASNLFTTGTAFGIANTAQRDSIVNLHWALPHKNSGLRDDIQALYVNSEVFANYYSSQNDFGPVTTNPNALPGYGAYTWDDSYVYNGALMAAPDPTKVSTYFFPDSPPHNFGDPLPAALRDSNDNGVSVEKLQYQHAFSENAFLRVYGYMLYSNWFIDGPNTAAQPYYGAELAQYQIPDHTAGANISFTDQLTDKHLLTASYGYTQSNLQRYDIGFIPSHYSIASYLNGNTCYDPQSGDAVGCVWFERNSVDATTGHTEGDIQNVLNGTLPTPSAACLANPGCANATWLTTNNYFYTGSGAALNQVHTRFQGFSIGDQWRPDDRWNVNIGVRVENFRYVYGPTGAGDPTRQFWFNEYNNEYCTAGIGTAPVSRADSSTGVLGACPSGTTLLAGSANALTNPGNVPDYVVARWQPRISFTYTVNPNSVIRGSAGVYARPPNSSWVQYNVVQEDLPVYLGTHFAAYGYTAPEHSIRPDTSYNYDLSWEQRLKGTDMSFKLTPFYRATRDQLQNFFIDPAGGLESGTNVGNQVSSGVEFAFTKGDFSRNGFAGQLSYTYTHSRIRYENFQGQNVNVIDQLNNYVNTYNGFTKAGGGSPCYFLTTAPTTPGAGTANCAQPNVATNPYYNNAPQALFDRNAWYTTYDVIPGPFAGLNGYAVPDVVSILLNYKRDRFTATVGMNYSSGASYGAPTTVPGYDPSTCAANLVGAGADPASCTGQIFTPNPYSGSFDNLGQYKQPWTFTLGLNLQYAFTPRITAQLGLVNLVNTCGQRGYPWDNPNICTYGALGTGLMASAGNFYPNSNATTPPPQMLYPYGAFVNNTNTGFVGVRQPVQLTGSLQIKI